MRRRPTAGEMLDWLSTTARERLNWLARFSWQTLITALRAMFVVWMRLRPRARLATTLATLVVVASLLGGVSASMAATVQGLAVLLLAGIGVAMIIRAPFRRRRW